MDYRWLLQVVLTELFLLTVFLFAVSHQLLSSTTFSKIQADKKSFDYAKRIHTNWYFHALKALFGQLGKHLHQNLSHDGQILLATCLDNLTDDFDLIFGARCLIEARARLHQQSKKLFVRNDHTVRKKQELKGIMTNWNTYRGRDKVAGQSVQRRSGTYLMLKAQISRAHDAVLLGRTNVGKLQLQRRDSRRRVKFRKKRSPYRLLTSHTFRSDNTIMDINQIQNHPPLIDSSLSPIQKVAKLIRILYHGVEQPEGWILTYNRILEFKKMLDESATSSGIKVYQLRLYDLVLGHDHPTKSKTGKGKVRQEDLFAMIYDFVNKNVRRRSAHNMNFELLSPRLMPVMPDKIKSKKRYMSPTILSFYNDDSDDNIAAFPKILEKTQLSDKDRDAILEMIMDVSGAKQAVELAMDLFNKKDFYGLKSEFFEVTQRLTSVFKLLEKTFSEEQRKEIDEKGYTFLEVKQYRMVLNEHGVNNMDEVGVDITQYELLDRRKREDALWDYVSTIAQNNTTIWKRGKRDAISVLGPVVLSPYMFSPVFGLSIIGPVVLSPNIFSPLVFNPSVLGPFVLSPAIAMPFVISPYILSPYVMTPIVMAPFILNPYILSPNVLNPYVLSPVILSPFVFCPDVLSPQTLGGAFLSPNVFSPAIGTESFLMASVLSPSWMS